MNTSNHPDKTDGTVSLADEEAVKQLLVGAVLNLWDVVKHLTRLRPSKRERYRVTIFGSARAKPGTFVYDITIPRCVSTADEAIALVREHHDLWRREQNS